MVVNTIVLIVPLAVAALICVLLIYRMFFMKGHIEDYWDNPDNWGN